MRQKKTKLKTILLSLQLLVALSVFSQQVTEVKVRVTDAETKTGITDANVLIQETMMMAKTAQFGIAVFPIVPVRQVTIEVQKEGYVPRKEEINITNEPSNNTFTMELVKEKDNTVTIYGVVKTGSKRLSDVAVTLTIGSYQGKVITTKNGDYNFQVPKGKITTKVKLLFAHSRFAVQEREFEVLQSQQVKEVDAVVLSGAVEDEKIPLENCYDSYKKHYQGIVCLDNQMGFDFEVYLSTGFGDGIGYVKQLFLSASKTNCTPRLTVNYYDATANLYDVKFYFRTIAKHPAEDILYATITVPLEKCWKRVYVLNKENIHFSKEEPR